MTYSFLGRSGLKVSSLCLGCMTFGGSLLPGNCTKEASFELLDAFEAAGGNFIDTANGEPSCSRRIARPRRPRRP